jgi:hypothetical protein
MWVTHREPSRLIALDWIVSKRDHLFDLEIPEEAVVSITTIRLREKPEKQEDITDTNSVVRQMRLRGSGLAKCAPTILEHGIMVTKIAADYSSSGCGLDDLGETEVCVGGDGPMLGRDGKADRPAVNNRRRDAARAAIETLPAENDPHVNWPPSQCYRT